LIVAPLVVELVLGGTAALRLVGRNSPASAWFGLRQGNAPDCEPRSDGGTRSRDSEIRQVKLP